MELLGLLVALVLVGLLAQRYGVDSRDARPGAGVGSQLVGGAAHRRAIDE